MEDPPLSPLDPTSQQLADIIQQIGEEYPPPTPQLTPPQHHASQNGALEAPRPPSVSIPAVFAAVDPAGPLLGPFDASREPLEPHSGLLIPDKPLINGHTNGTHHTPNGSPLAHPPSHLGHSSLPEAHLGQPEVYPPKAEANGTPCSGRPMGTGPVLVMIEEPVERCRFRYKAEQGPHGALRSAAGKKSKSCPKVRLCGLSRAELSRAYVVVGLYTVEAVPRPHVNDLWGSACQDGFCRVTPDQDGIASFPNLGIMRQKEKEVAEALLAKYRLQEERKADGPLDGAILDALRQRASMEAQTMKDCLHSVRLGFQGVVPGEENAEPPMATPLLMSQAVHNSQNPGFTELRIAEVDRSSGSGRGGDKLWLRCAAKVRRDHIKVRFVEPSSGWEADGVFSASDVYEQILIILETPPYRDPALRSPAPVQLHLLRSSDNEYSPPIDFVYLPSDDGPESKRRRTMPVLGPDSFGFGWEGPGRAGPSGAPTQPGPSALGPSNQHNTQTQLHRHACAQRADSGFGSMEPRPATGPPSEGISMSELRASLTPLPDGGARVEALLARLWETQRSALVAFASEGDPGALVAATRHLVGCPDEEGNSPLHLAVRNGQPYALRTLLGSIKGSPMAGELVNARNARGQTPLNLGVRLGEAESVHYLMAAGADRSAADGEGNSAVHSLAQTFAEDIHRDVLLPPSPALAGSHASNAAVLGALNAAGDSLAHLTVKCLKLGLLEVLAEAGAPVDLAERSSGKRPLHHAVAMGDVEAVRLLLRSGAEVDSEAHDGSTPLHWAVLYRQEPIVKDLLHAGAQPDKASAAWDRTPDTADDDDEDDEVEGSARQLCSPRDLAQGNDRVLALLRGEAVENLTQPTALCRPQPPASVGIRTPFSPPPSSLPPQESLDDSEAAGPSFASARVTHRGDSAEFIPKARIADDLGSLDFVTRLRLSKRLDEGGGWEGLAEALECGHMVEVIAASLAAESGSPTVLLLDQYEQMAGASISALQLALVEAGQTEAADLISQRKDHFARNSSGAPGASAEAEDDEPMEERPRSPPPPLIG